jgi:hypothetical protein
VLAMRSRSYHSLSAVYGAPEDAPELVARAEPA